MKRSEPHESSTRRELVAHPPVLPRLLLGRRRIWRRFLLQGGLYGLLVALLLWLPASLLGLGIFLEKLPIPVSEKLLVCGCYFIGGFIVGAITNWQLKKSTWLQLWDRWQDPPQLIETLWSVAQDASKTAEISAEKAPWAADLLDKEKGIPLPPQRTLRHQIPLPQPLWFLGLILLCGLSGAELPQQTSQNLANAPLPEATAPIGDPATGGEASSGTPQTATSSSTGEPVDPVEERRPEETDNLPAGSAGSANPPANQNRPPPQPSNSQVDLTSALESNPSDSGSPLVEVASGDFPGTLSQQPPSTEEAALRDVDIASGGNDPTSRTETVAPSRADPQSLLQPSESGAESNAGERVDGVPTPRSDRSTIPSGAEPMSPSDPRSGPTKLPQQMQRLIERYLQLRDGGN